MDPADLAATTAAFERGYADAAERQAYYQSNPGVPMGYDPPPDPWRPPPRGLGYSAGVDPVAVYVADQPSLAPSVLPTPPPVDLSTGPALTGATHGGWQVYQRPAAPQDSVVYAGTGVPRRRSLFARLLGRR
jgi:hypothetical protein